jgi:hypothetical protein
MKPRSVLATLAAAVLLAHTVVATAAALSAPNPLEGRLLQRSDGGTYIVHNGARFAVELADVGDRVIDAIPQASQSEWQTLFSPAPGVLPEVPGGDPKPFPGYS